MPPSFTIAIGSATASEEAVPDFSLRPEVNLLKSALLYGDTVTVTSTVLSSLGSRVNHSLKWIIEGAPSDPSPLHALLITRLVSLVDAFRLSGHGHIREWHESALRYLEMCEGVEVSPALIRPRLADTKAEILAKDLIELGEAARSGLVDFHVLRGFWTFETFEAVSEEAAADPLLTDKTALNEFREILTEDAALEMLASLVHVLRDAKTYPLFDGGAADFLGTFAVRTGVSIPEWAYARAKATVIGAGLSSMLPSFQDATVGEILALRRELEKPLRRFRGGVLDLADEISATPLSADFAEAVVMNVYHRHVAPTLEELHEAIKENSTIRELAAGVLDRPSAMIGGAVAIATHSIELAALAAALDRVSRAALSARAARREARRNRFFFLRQVDRALRRARDKS